MMNNVEILAGVYCDLKGYSLDDHKSCIILKSSGFKNEEDLITNLSNDVVNKILKPRFVGDDTDDISIKTYLDLKLNLSFLPYSIYDVISNSWTDREKILFLRFLDDVFFNGLQSREDYLIMYFNLIKSGLDDSFLRLSSLYNYYKNSFEKTPEKLWLALPVSFIFKNTIPYLKHSELPLSVDEKFIDYVLSIEDVFENEDFLIIFLEYLSFNKDLIKYFLLNLCNESIFDDVLLPLKDNPAILGEYCSVLILLLNTGVVEFEFFESILLEKLLGDTDFNYPEYYKGIIFNATRGEMVYLFENVIVSDFMLILKFLIKFDIDISEHINIIGERLKNVVENMIDNENLPFESDFKIIVEFSFLYSSRINDLSALVLKLSQFYPDDLSTVVCLRHHYSNILEFTFIEMKIDLNVVLRVLNF